MVGMIMAVMEEDGVSGSKHSYKKPHSGEQVCMHFCSLKWREGERVCVCVYVCGPS